MKHLFTLFILVFLASCGSDDSNSGTQAPPQAPSQTPPPDLSGVSVETGSYFYDDPSDDALRVSVTFSENVNVTGTPRIELTIGAATKYATYASGSGTSTLTFSYDVSSD